MKKERKHRPVVSPVSLKEVYAYLGDYTAKLIIDPKESLHIDSVEVEVRNADGQPMEFTAKRWGTKLNVSFTIDGSTPDGVSIIDVTMRGRSWSEVRERFTFWVFK